MDRVAAVLRELGIAESELSPVGKVGVPRPVRRWRAGDVVVERADNPAGALRIQRETAGRRWAARVGVPTAPIVDADPDGAWLVARWVAPVATIEESYVDAALDAAETIAAASPPPDGPPSQRWSSPRRTRLARTLRGIVGGVPLAQWWRARRRAAQLPQVPLAHGDFYHRNVPGGPGGVAVVDWEYVGPGPRHGDMLRLWSVLPARAERDYAMRAVLARVPATDHASVGVLAHWLALRRLGENVKAPRAHRNADDTAHAREVLAEARNWSALLS